MVDDVTAPLPPHAGVPDGVATLADYETRAAAHMAAEAWRYVQEGSGEERTLHDNRAAFARLRLLPRVLADLRGGSTATTLFGRTHAAPILLAPIAFHRLAHPEGELATARAAAALETGMVLSTLSSVTLEEVATASRAAATDLGRPPASLWFQLYLQDERARSLDLVRRAETAGYEAIMLTVDSAVKRASLTLPAGVDAANLRGHPRLRQTTSAGGAILFGTLLVDAAPRWDDVAWLRAQTRLPILLKGVLNPADAAMAIEHGADGLVVSNHGGRVLDDVVTAPEMMPAMADAIGGRVPLLLDGGVRSGTDIAKALALGATAVMIGRPQVHALAVAGMAGVAHILHLLRAELEQAMVQLGCRTPAALTPDRLRTRFAEHI
ncbi:alpha-hydroxy acid oxidase [Sphingomonas nostoxanthinifaciens]|uniref:alpha-hydroxy acid oxidase n=1 Tax=Sphingomonas nostoxanthinifaciens TaxID=2872652 RepID=UPI001CC1E899|nr:alpha-hydroxy acid oxidase [Sphingomonas nostoxanthinifaciens]UAK25049.1 alpha-hydroxy-acid oxidizing protein [Sphingomonas nostoxanthinifaciens]